MRYGRTGLRWGVARPAVLLAVLIGLFFMHGTAMGAATGCEGVSSHKAADMGMPDMSPQSAAKASGQTTVSVAVKAGRPMGHGSLCLADQPRARAFGVAALALALLVATAGLCRRPGWRFRRSTRAPPVAGSALLTRLCISRT